jgi:CPA2 family monovalent cation:H+ antiporter-2
LVATHARLSEPLAERVVEFLVVALGLLPCFGIWRGSHQLAVRFATSAGAGPNEVSAEVSTAMTRMLELPILFTIVIVLIATVAPFVRAIDGAVVMAAAAIVLGVMTWRSARQIQDHVREAARILVERLPRQMTGVQAVRSSDRLADLLSEIGPLEPVRVPDAGNVVGKTLEELNLRALTGAMVVALIRKGASIFVPDGTQILRPGDSLALAGPSEALAAARQLLEARDAAQYTEVSA